jgi:large subunit ribosomal protein L16
MQFVPSNTKYKKQQKGKSICRINKNVNFFRLSFGIIGLKSKAFGRLTTNQIKTIRQTINKVMKKQGRLILNIFPQTPITKKPLEIRMGKGKGNVDHWVYKVKPGMLLLEIESENVSLAIRAIKLIQIRIPLTTQIVYN